MARKRRNRASTEDAEPDLPPRRTKRLMRRLAVLLLLVVGLVLAAPTIVGRTALRNTLLVQAMPAGWNIQSQQASLGWLSSQSLTGLEITDEQGKPLLTIESVALPKSLFSLAVNRADLGKVELVRPTVYVETRPAGSNWEDFVQALQSLQQESSGEPVALQLQVVDGVVRGSDQPTGAQWMLEKTNVTATVGPLMDVSGSAVLTTSQAPQRGKINFRWQTDPAGSQQVELLAERLSLHPLEPWLRRFAPGTQLSGVLSTDARLTWKSDSQLGLVLESTGRLEASQLEVATPALAGDHLRSQRLAAPWKLRIADRQLSVEQLGVQADWANVDVTGTLALAEFDQLSLRNLPKTPATVSGKVDLAKLASMLPRTLQLRDGVRIDAGSLEFAAGVDHRQPQIAWQASASLQNVAGSDGRRQVRWQQPIELTAQARDSAVGPQLEQLTFKSAFAQATMQTQRDAIAGEFNLDLAKFSAELSQFVDMQTLQLRGLGEGTFTLARQGEQKFTATANVALTDLHVADAEQTVWSEPKLQVQLSASGDQQDLVPTTIASGRVGLSSPRDSYSIELLQPVDLRVEQPTWHAQAEGNGPLELWAGRLRPWVTVPNQTAGEVHLKANVKVAGESVQIVESSGSIVQLRVQDESLSIDEPRVEFSGDAFFDRRTGSLRTQEMQLLGSSFSVRAQNVEVATATAGAPTARGSVAFRADLERIAGIANMVGGQTSTWPRGTAVGQLQLASDAEQVRADFGVKVEQLELLRTSAAAGAVYGRPEVVWSEPQLELTGVTKYLTKSDRVEVEKLQVQGKTLQLNGSAGIDRVTSDAVLQANGLVEYDPNELAKLIASYAAGEVQVQGDRQVRFQLAGPLSATGTNAATHWSQRWNVTAEAGWASAGAFGLPLGGGRLQTTLRDGQLQIAPLDVAVGEGRFTAQPLVRLTPGAELFALARGPLVTDVAISPEVSETMLKYVAPILAGATRTEGKFSIDLDQTEVPLADAKKARVQGRLMTHRLAVSPGPMTNQLIALVSQIEALTKRERFLQAAAKPRTKSFLTMTEQQVDFQVVDGRVYHRNLEFMIDKVVFRSRGSVGFDQTLALEIEVPIQDKWIESEPALRGLVGESVRIPIYGTFQEQKIDGRPIADLSTKLLRGAAEQAIGDELNRQFEKLFGK